MVKIKDGKLPKEVEIDGKKSESNAIDVTVSVGSDKVTAKSITSDVEVLVIENPKITTIISPDTLKEKESDVEQKLIDVEILIALKKSGSNVSNSEIRKAENNLKDSIKELEKYKSSASDKVNVTAYLTKNKKTTTVSKTFTITEKGLN